MRYRKERKNIKVIENFSKNTYLWKHNQRGTLSMEEFAIKYMKMLYFLSTSNAFIVASIQPKL